ncbi:hypothetical protein HCZ87_18715, partial [Phaeobacter sp. HF9A]|nr:hypothetical protein [Phaeobacter sp. HF9A]
LADALASKHGPLLRDLLRDTVLPEGRAQGATPDQAEQILHQLREIALLLLAREASTKGSALAAKLRRKGLREEAARMVQDLMDQLAAEMIPAQL